MKENANNEVNQNIERCLEYIAKYGKTGMLVEEDNTIYEIDCECLIRKNNKFIVKKTFVENNQEDELKKEDIEKEIQKESL